MTPQNGSDPVLTLSILSLPPSNYGEKSTEWSLIDWYLEQQGRLTAVERFSQAHAGLTEPVYRSLLPAKGPGQGEQYGFEVDLDRCSGCKACVTACHSLNGLDDQETWREVGLLTGGTSQLPFMQHVTTACHHCVEPACMDVCPTLAYEKDSVTGIVKHLDDQCFGCQYCILACPYNVPKYNERLGVVRKCDLCSQRLFVGEAPACVQACPHEAIRIQIVNIDQIQADCETSQFLPGTPDPQYTLPTTNYKTSRPLPRNLIPADYFRVQTEHAHGPLVTMLVLTQLAVGGFVIPQVVSLFADSSFPNQVWKAQACLSLIICYLALSASLMHLGRPWLAYRAMLGLKTSWLSREILAFGLFSAAATWWTGTRLFPRIIPQFGLSDSRLLGMVSFSGLIGIYCSAMIYHRTKRPFWNLYQSGTRFGLTSTLLGLSLTWVSLALTQSMQPSIAVELALYATFSQWGIIATALLKGIFELGALAPLADRPQTPLKRSALLLVGPLRQQLFFRFFLLFLSGVIFTAVPLTDAATSSVLPSSELGFSLFCLFGLTGGELLERSLFFKASVAFRMPGGPST